MASDKKIMGGWGIYKEDIWQTKVYLKLNIQIDLTCYAKTE
jgi:hypothetical protein